MLEFNIEYCKLNETVKIDLSYSKHGNYLMVHSIWRSLWFSSMSFIGFPSLLIYLIICTNKLYQLVTLLLSNVFQPYIDHLQSFWNNLKGLFSIFSSTGYHDHNILISLILLLSIYSVTSSILLILHPGIFFIGKTSSSLSFELARSHNLSVLSYIHWLYGLIFSTIALILWN